MIGCYPNGKPSDPEIYVSAVAAVLAQYPAEIVARVTDPRVGVARRSKFMPSIAEIVAACDDEMRPLIVAWRDEQQIAAREAANKPVNQTMVEKFKALLRRLGSDAVPDPLEERERLERAAAKARSEQQERSAHISRTMADLAKRKAEKLPLTNIAQEVPE